MSEFGGFVKRPENYEEWKEKTNNHPTVIENKDIIVNSTSHGFFKFMTFLFVIVIALAAATFLYLMYQGKLSPTIQNTINPAESSDVNINNSYEIKPAIYNNDASYNQFNVTIELKPTIYANCTS